METRYLQVWRALVHNHHLYTLAGLRGLSIPLAACVKTPCAIATTLSIASSRLQHTVHASAIQDVLASGYVSKAVAAFDDTAVGMWGASNCDDGAAEGTEVTPSGLRPSRGPTITPPSQLPSAGCQTTLCLFDCCCWLAAPVHMG